MSEPNSATAPAADTASASEPSIGDLVAGVSRDVSTLIRAEIELAKAEMKVSAKRAGLGAGMFAAAGALLSLTVVLASFAAAYGLVALGLATGWAFLIVAGAYLLIAVILGIIGAVSVRRVGPPQRTVATAKDTVATLKRRPSSS